MNTSQIQIKDSIATKLLKVVFSIYVLVAITVTLVHMIGEYYNMKNGVLKDFAIMHQTFTPVLAKILWNADLAGIMNSAEGLIQLPAVVGVHIFDDKDIEVANLGNTLDVKKALISDNLSLVDQASFQPPSSHLFWYAAPMRYIDVENDIDMKIGTLILYSSRNVVFQKVQYGFFFIVINSMIKTIALWVIFLWIGRRLLTRPLAALTSATEQLDLGNLEQISINLRSTERTELKILEEAFNSMIQKLLTSRTELEGLIEKLRLADKLKDEFIANISHELRTPLTGILGFAQLLSMNAVEDETTKQEYYKNIALDSERLMRILNNVINISLLESQSKSVVIDTISLKTLSKMLSYEWENKFNGKLVIDFPETFIEGFQSDEKLLQLIFNELICNSYLFNENLPEVHISVQADQNIVIFQIRDHGIGIASEHLSHIFKKFYRVDSSLQYKVKGGLGLGLAVVKEAIALLNGTVRVESQLGQGSIFSLEFPINSGAR